MAPLDVAGPWRARLAAGAEPKARSQRVGKAAGSDQLVKARPSNQDKRQQSLKHYLEAGTQTSSEQG